MYIAGTITTLRMTMILWLSVCVYNVPPRVTNDVVDRPEMGHRFNEKLTIDDDHRVDS